MSTVSNSKDLLLLSKSNRSSHHSRGEFVSISVRKEDPKAKAGIRLEQDSAGRLKVRNIASNGLFGDTELAIGDIVLSINRVRLSDGEPPEALVEVANQATRNITIVVKKTNVPQTQPNEKLAKKLQKEQEIKDDLVQDNNREKPDTYNSVISRLNEDGSLNCKTAIVESSANKSPKMTTTISARKEDREDPVGIAFCVQDKKLWIAAMEEDSIFAGTNLEVGDCVLSINDMSFRDYVDAEYALMLIGKAKAQVTLVVVKNEEGFRPVSVVSSRPYKTAKTDKPPKRNSSSSSVLSRNKKSACGSSSAPNRSSSFTSCSSRSSRSRTSQGENPEDEEAGDLVAPLQSSKVNSRKLVKRHPVGTPKHTAQMLQKRNTAATTGFVHGGIDDEDDEENDTASLSSDNSGSTHALPPSHKSDFKIEKYREVNISAPKSYWKESIGIEFRLDKKVKLLYVHKLLDGNLLERTSLEEGDYILTINDVCFRNSPDPRHAFKACMQAKESINLVVLKDESTYLETAFNLDESVTNLNWMVDSVRGGLVFAPLSP